jgi:EAL domain-containing protein (putative c-di-GMP-specific phosphodiesterase class I)
MRQLKEIGIAMVLDDFGTGYSSINYLIRFPIDKIKIDRSFTQGALARQDCAAVIASTLALSEGLGLLTTAEGVEDVAQFEYVRNAGVDLVQGYLFGKPVPMAEFGPQAARTLKTLASLTKPPQETSPRKLEGSKLRASALGAQPDRSLVVREGIDLAASVSPQSIG